MVNEWLCNCCGMTYATSKEMTLEEAQEWYGILDCLNCKEPIKLVPRYTDYELAVMSGQLAFWNFQEINELTCMVFSKRGGNLSPCTDRKAGVIW